MSFVKKHEVNLVGNDWVVGDIHGNFKRLRKLLDNVGFNEETDRLFSVGDMIDRGPESDDFIEWCEKPWFLPVIGNHEDEMIRCVEEDKYEHNTWIMDMHRQAGHWIAYQPHEVQMEAYWTASSLPIMREIEMRDGLKYGIVHANVPYADWEMAKDMLLYNEEAVKFCVWDRTRFQNQNQQHVRNIDLVFVGHNVVNQVEILGNVVNIDTGAVFTKFVQTDEEKAAGLFCDNGLTLVNLTEFEMYNERMFHKFD